MAGHLDYGLGFVLEELIECFADTRKVDIVMRDDDGAGLHPQVKKLEGLKGAGIQVHIKVDKGEAAVLDGLAGGRKISFVEVNTGKPVQEVAHTFETACVLALLECRIDGGGLRQSLESVEQVQLPVTLGFTNHFGRAAEEDPHFGYIALEFRCCQDGGADQIRLVNANGLRWETGHDCPNALHGFRPMRLREVYDLTMMNGQNVLRSE